MGKKVYGIVPPIITPVDEQERVAEGEFRKLLNHCVDHGLHGIFVAGSNGECMGLTQRERDRAIKIALDEVGDKVPVVCGVMDSSTKRVIENVKRLEDMGGKIAVITPVFYARHATQDETVRLFEEVSNHTSADLMIYNIPTFTGQKLTADTIFKIAQIDKVIGYKDTSGSLPDFMNCLAHFEDSDFILLQGSSDLAAVSMLLGADGCVPSMAPLFPELFVRLYDFCKAGNIQKAKEYNQLLNLTGSMWKMTKNQTTSTKYAISKTGLCNGRVIHPTEPLREGEAEQIDIQYEKVRIIVEQALKNDML